jgi:hypothetical protein
MKISWPLFFLLAGSPHAFAGTPQNGFLSHVRCQKSVSAALKTLGVLPHWRRQVDPGPGGLSYRTNTTQFGKWIEVHIAPNSNLELHQVDPAGSQTINWDLACVKKTTITKNKDAGVNAFRDSDLAELMKKNKTGLIYIWSPGMVYSMDFYPEFERTAHQMKLPLTVLMDPYFDETQAKEKAQEFKMPFLNRRVEAVELLMRDIGTHYPETLVYKNGKLSDERIVGVMSPEVLESEISSNLRKLP